jgi:DnaJ-class molecular chaperone
MAQANDNKKSDDEVKPDTPQSAPAICRRCKGTGRLNGAACPDCDGTGFVTVLVGDT